MRKTVVMIPTYNESENVAALIQEILALNTTVLKNKHEVHVLVVDDNSPDGTSQIVHKLSERDSRVQVLTRYDRRGRGSAGIDGFKAALKAGADYIIEMDADFSHHPRYIPDLIAAADQGADVVLGSRFVDGGMDTDRGFHRQWITKAAGLYVRTVLSLGVHDVSSGYRCFKRGVLERVGLDSLVSTGPSIVLELLYKCSQLGVKIVEVPIVFIDRKAGETKLNFKTLIKTLLMVLRIKELHKA